MKESVLEELQIIAFTHRNCALEDIGLLHLEESVRQDHLATVKERLGLREIMYLSTCNRVEIVVVAQSFLSIQSVFELLSILSPSQDPEVIQSLASKATIYHGSEAARHFFTVSSSLDSMIVGEREIITQVRDAFEKCRASGLTGDTIRLLIKKSIEAAKDVFTGTQIAHKPVSVVSLAYRMLRDLHVDLNARILLIGAGQTNTVMGKYLRKHGFRRFVVFNRTLAKGEALAGELGGRAYSLESLSDYQEGFDVMITCTGSSTEIITPELYKQLARGEEGNRIVIDLAIPYDFNRSICESNPVKLIEITSLRQVADDNLKLRQGEMTACYEIIDKHLSELNSLYRQRSVEVAMKDVPEIIREIRNRAVNGVFAKDIETLDVQSREVLGKVLEYMEKKYISVPMKMAREIILGPQGK